MHAEIRKIIDARALNAAASEYDRGVCVRAVGAARACVESVPVDGTAVDYAKAVLATLEPVYNTYNDADGVYTSGKASIGDVYFDIAGLLKDHVPSGT